MNGANIKNKYRFTLELSICISIGFFIFLFYVFPKWSPPKKYEINYTVPTIDVIQIPRTRQRLPRQPRPVRPVIPVAADEAEILDEVPILTNEVDVSSITQTDGREVTAVVTRRPRQIVEAMPKVEDEEASGRITLSIKIGINGKMVEYKVLENTTTCPLCLNAVINAARRSRWQPASSAGNPVEFWIEKTYIIN